MEDVGGFEIDARRLVALFLVFALTGSALAVAQQQVYGSDELEANGVEAVQQHSVFVEIVVEKEEDKEEIHEFGAVVGLIKKCKKVRNVFDNAVLWFNDQFLFGEKAVEEYNVSAGEDVLGYNPEDNNLIEKDGSTGRWGGCYTPDGFAHAIGADDPYGVGTYNGTLPDEERCEDPSSASEGVDEREQCAPPNDNMDVVKQLIDLDNRCRGCIFEYQSSFFINDPNKPDSNRDVTWIVDKFVYPLSVVGNLFQEGEDNLANGGTCDSGAGLVGVSDPRDNYPHHDRCNEDHARNEHSCSQYSSDDEAGCRPPGEGTRSSTENGTTDATLVEPLYSVHLQTDPSSATGMGYVDQADWQYKNGSGPVDGMPYPQDPTDPAFGDCQNDPAHPYECAIEYNFLLAVDFAAFDRNDQLGGEDEYEEGAVEHGRDLFPDPQPKAWQGNSHPHHANGSVNAGPNHEHSTVDLDIFYHDQAPWFTMDQAYWYENGGPPEVTDDCSTVDDASATETQREAVESRTPIVCDTEKDEPYHAHDGSQTIGEG